MNSTENLGGFQLLSLLAVIRRNGDAHPARIQDELEQIARRTVTISTVYVTMERLRKKGMVRSWLGEPQPVRGGRRRRYYEITDLGLRSVREARQELDRMWVGLDSHPDLGRR